MLRRGSLAGRRCTGGMLPATAGDPALPWAWWAAGGPVACSVRLGVAAVARGPDGWAGLGTGVGLVVRPLLPSPRAGRWARGWPGGPPWIPGGEDEGSFAGPREEGWAALRCPPTPGPALPLRAGWVGGRGPVLAPAWRLRSSAWLLRAPRGSRTAGCDWARSGGGSWCRDW